MGKRPWQLDDIVVSSAQIAKVENQIAKSSFQRNLDEARSLLSRLTSTFERAKKGSKEQFDASYYPSAIASAQSSVDYYQKEFDNYKTPLVNNLWNPIPLPEPQIIEQIADPITIPEIEPVIDIEPAPIQVSDPAPVDPNRKFTAQWEDYFSTPNVTQKFTATYYSWEAA